MKHPGNGTCAKNAIDLAKLLTGRSYEGAVAWLEEVGGCKEAQAATWVAAEDPPEPFELPAPVPVQGRCKKRENRATCFSLTLGCHI